jgi:hypothetical protein
MDNSAFWQKQCEWKQSIKAQAKAEPYDSELVWNIEGPTRKKTDALKR